MVRTESLGVRLDSILKVDVKKEFEKDSIFEDELIEKVGLKRKKRRKLHHTK